MAYLGSWEIDDQLTFYANLHDPTGASAVDHDANGSPIWRIYEDNASPDIASGNMYTFHTASTTGFYSTCVTLSAGNGFEQGKNYVIYMAASVASTTGTMHHVFQVGAQVKTASVADNAITANAIQASAFTNAKFDADFLTNSLIADNTIDTEQFAASALSNAKIADGLIIDSTFGANAITSTVLANNAITAAKINASAISACKFAANAVDVAAIAASAFTNAKFDADFLTNSLVADNTIAAENIATDSITATKIAASAITNAEVADGLIVDSTFGSGAITATVLATDSIGAAEIAAAAGNKIADHIFRRSASLIENSSDGDDLNFRSPYGAVAKLVNRFDASDGTTACVFEADDTTVIGRQTMTACTNASPIVELNTE